MNIDVNSSEIVFSGVDTLDVGLTLDCGQAFRWSKKENGLWHGVAFGRAVDIDMADGRLIIRGEIQKGDERLWSRYFDLDRDYAAICERLRADKYLDAAIGAYPGIRILKQEPWEALCSFIISQNNNIPRIKGIIERLCCTFGDDLGGGDFTFPSADRLAGKSVEDLAPLRAGFRAKYIIDAAKKVAGGEIDLSSLETAEMDAARAELIKIKGVGAKVAECTLLYGCGRAEAFPVDVWVRRIMQELYPDGLPQCTDGAEGIAQQYLFHWRRNVDDIPNNTKE